MMRQSSESIAAIAAALSKAQLELVNPVRSSVATIATKGGERSFRYAPLCSGLEIVRKTLGRFEIAIIQATSLDAETKRLVLTTTLAHASGEWISAEWPICALVDSNSPAAMGAALTYARRYGLFTLVGIAGDDDVDAPDLPNTVNEPYKENGVVKKETKSPTSRIKRQLIDEAKRASSALIDSNGSAELADELIAKIRALKLSKDVLIAASGILKEKNRLDAPNSIRVEQAFRAQISELDAIEHDQSSIDAEKPTTASSSINGARETITAAAEPAASGALEQNITSSTAESLDGSQVASATPMTKVRRIRRKDHLRFVANKPCLICGRRPCDAHHLRFAQPRALGMKVSDEFTVPLCRTHHREAHRFGDEAAWWQSQQVEPVEVAKQLWSISHIKHTGCDNKFDCNA